MKKELTKRTREKIENLDNNAIKRIKKAETLDELWDEIDIVFDKLFEIQYDIKTRRAANGKYKFEL